VQCPPKHRLTIYNPQLGQQDNSKQASLQHDARVLLHCTAHELSTALIQMTYFHACVTQKESFNAAKSTCCYIKMQQKTQAMYCSDPCFTCIGNCLCVRACVYVCMSCTTAVQLKGPGLAVTFHNRTQSRDSTRALDRMSAANRTMLRWGVATKATSPLQLSYPKAILGCGKTSLALTL